jgi:hypothetical protein
LPRRLFEGGVSRLDDGHRSSAVASRVVMGIELARGLQSAMATTPAGRGALA